MSSRPVILLIVSICLLAPAAVAAQNLNEWLHKVEDFRDKVEKIKKIEQQLNQLTGEQQAMEQDAAHPEELAIVVNATDNPITVNWVKGVEGKAWEEKHRLVQPGDITYIRSGWVKGQVCVKYLDTSGKVLNKVCDAIQPGYKWVVR